jgi:hypothetical protein
MEFYIKLYKIYKYLYILKKLCIVKVWKKNNTIIIVIINII